ncbi:hypothetical protein [Acidipropionibacterium timonense]|uniref:hypothetical protein n=1 Tax=Acidipropionibacterium timonense TaxID=2161818 RepID=UPI001436BA9F|nr:hypothetical protein [Acidipropionibacterium timonense]
MDTREANPPESRPEVEEPVETRPDWLVWGIVAVVAILGIVILVLWWIAILG